MRYKFLSSTNSNVKLQVQITFSSNCSFPL